jgi:hypothetical protein
MPTANNPDSTSRELAGSGAGVRLTRTAISSDPPVGKGKDAAVADAWSEIENGTPRLKGRETVPKAFEKVYTVT